MGAAAFQRDVGDADFEREVVERSREVPVVVDFWAPWCGPCRSLGPVLENLAERGGGAFVLAKVNVDEAPRVAQRYAVRSIPTVVGFRGGEPAAQFVGAQPEPVVARFIEALLPTDADRLAAEGASLAQDGHSNAAEDRFRAALAQEPRHASALLGMARLLAEREAIAEALDLLEQMPPGGAEAAEAERLAAALRTRSGAPGDEAELHARLVTDPGDVGARIGLGKLLAAQGHYEVALEELLEAVRRDPAFGEEAARRAMLDVFELIGREHPLVERFRTALARTLFR